MGYNNHHAGMHMIWHNHYAAYEDLEYYDRLAEEEEQFSENKSEEIPSSSKSLTVRSTNYKERQDIKKVAEKDMTQPDETLGKQKQNIKHKPKKHDDRESQWRPKYGTEMIINTQSFFNFDIVSRNLMLMSLKREIDIKRIILEAEDLMKKDKRMNPKPSEESSWAWLPILEKAGVFLNILAEKLDCSLAEFFLDDERSRTAFLHKLLISIEDNEWDIGEIDPETGEAYICINHYGVRFKEIGYEYHDPMGEHSRRMDLTLEKVPQENGRFWYTLSYGSLYINPRSAYNYVTMGAYLWEEEGKLKDFIEKLISKHPEWVNKDA